MQIPIRPKLNFFRSLPGTCSQYFVIDDCVPDLQLGWRQSALARLWRLIGSGNIVGQYFWELYDACKLVDIGVGLPPVPECPFPTPNRTNYTSAKTRDHFTVHNSWSGSNISTLIPEPIVCELYRGHVFAINLCGMSPEAAITWARHYG